MKKYVLNKTTKQVLRWGFCDFANDGKFNSITEEIISTNLFPSVDTSIEVCYWNGTSFQTIPI